MKKLCSLLALILCLASALPALAEPFGAKMGDGMDRFPELAGKSGRTFFVQNAPAPQADFGSYIVTFEKDGLSAISGVKTSCVLSTRISVEYRHCGEISVPLFARCCANANSEDISASRYAP